MSNLFWFNCLAVIGVAMAVITIYEKRRLTAISTLVLFYIFATSITWLGEFFVLGLFDSYAYKPGLTSDPWAENLTAHLILNSTLWPGVALMVVAYSLDYGKVLLISAAFTLVEALFVKFGLYEHHWWQYYMTTASVFLYLVIVKAWFPKILRPPGRWSRAVLFYFIAFVILHLPIPLLLLWGKQYYGVALTDNLVRSSTIFILLYQLVETGFLTFFVCVLSKWYWKAVPFAIAFAGQSILAAKGILVFQDNWDLSLLLLIYALCVAICILIEKVYLLPVKRTIG